MAWLGASAHGHWAQLGRGEGGGFTPALRWRGSASGPAAIACRVRASGRAHGVRKELANASRPIGRVKEGKKGEFHGGRARRRHG